MQTDRGFSLLELLVAIAVVAILAVAASPLYQKHAQRLRVLDGQAKLLEVIDLEHRHYARALIYTDDFAALGLRDETAAASERAHYRIAAAACEERLSECVKLTATPVRDTDTVLTLDSQGRRTPTDAWR